MILIAVILQLLISQLIVVNSIDVSNKKLSDYKLDELKGIHSVSIVRETPPSLSNFTIYLNINDGSSKPFKQIDVEHCPANSQICGLEAVSLPGKDKIITEIIAFPNSMNFNVEPNKEENSFEIKFDGATWGSQSINANLQFICNPDTDTGLTADSWNDHDLKLIWETPAACVKGSKDDKKKTPPPPGDNNKDKDNKNKEDPEDTSHWGWFTWLFIFMVLIFAAHIIGNAWLNANNINGGSNEFWNELMDSLVDVLNRLPSFLKEIWNKLFGGVSERGGYSAV